LRIVFFGTPELAIPSLEVLGEVHEIVSVVCQPDKPVGRKKTLQAPPVKVWASEHGIPVVQPTKLNDGSFEAWLKEQNPDVCALVAYGRLLKQSVLDVPKHGFINMHPSLLPLYRGPSPIHTAVLHGDAETGVSIMKLDSGMDTGDVLLQETVALPADATSEQMNAELSRLGAEMLVKSLELIEAGEAYFTPQDESLATHTRMFVKQDGAINWECTAQYIYNQVRSSIPWPVAYFRYNDQPMRIYACAVVEEIVDAQPGVIIRIEENQLIVSTGKCALGICIIQAPGKKAMPIADYQRGNPFIVGTQLENG
jgi:methionyl-tRNA formyltransferase